MVVIVVCIIMLLVVLGVGAFFLYQGLQDKRERKIGRLDTSAFEGKPVPVNMAAPGKRP